jgi:hypothetical protein
MVFFKYILEKDYPELLTKEKKISTKTLCKIAKNELNFSYKKMKAINEKATTV